MSTESPDPRPEDLGPEDTGPEKTGPEDDETGAPYGVERLLALSDGVVSIALTLLVLQIAIPAVSSMQHPDAAADLANALDKNVRGWISYIISFYVVIQFWILHHQVFRRIARQREGLVLWNAAFLFAVSVMPFTSDLLGKDGNNPLAVTIFALNLLLANVAMQGAQEYARRRDLMRPGRYDFGAYRWDYGASLAVIALSLVLAWIDTTLAELCWLLFGVVPQAGASARRGWSRVRARG
ncbi:MAG TPA: TMEM175 family protein [Streptosporangiaceae bacterium]